MSCLGILPSQSQEATTGHWLLVALSTSHPTSQRIVMLVVFSMSQWQIIFYDTAKQDLAGVWVLFPSRMSHALMFNFFSPPGVASGSAHSYPFDSSHTNVLRPTSGNHTRPIPIDYANQPPNVSTNYGAGGTQRMQTAGDPSGSTRGVSSHPSNRTPGFSGPRHMATAVDPVNRSSYISAHIADAFR
ncbi:hypothetical protein NLI96_g11592 [Meripilus lineatus]|uniref:Uncharacterized protein n=1 Tax=Meripilus lineatus TaxID=2056292 RepID=A0AAD5UWD0_9APHY|nr:hypothetical protein NLI96_g11592 [Physisporinus lineatus]